MQYKNVKLLAKDVFQSLQITISAVLRDMNVVSIFIRTYLLSFINFIGRTKEKERKQKFASVKETLFSHK